MSDLFDGFKPTSTEDWEEAIVKSLKGKNYDDTLIWKTLEGIDFRPYYRAEDVDPTTNMPGEAPYARGNKIENNDWEIRADICHPDPKEANKLALSALSRGANNIAFTLPISDKAELITALDGILLDAMSVHFACDDQLAHKPTWFAEEVSDKGISLDQVSGGFDYDPIGHLASSGNWYENQNSDLSKASQLIGSLKSFSPKFKGIEVNAEIYHDAGASIVQELACALAHGNEYLAHVTENGHKAAEVSKRMQFKYAVGSHYFLEIAKLKAARRLWSRVVEQYDASDSSAQATFIHCTTSSWNKAIYDPYVNMLRVTTEAMAATLGMCDSLSITPFSSSYQTPDEFANRIAQNVQIVLKEESYFHKIVDPAAGSYYIEMLSDKLAEKAWEFFQKIEKKGGIISALSSGFIQEEIATTAEEKARRFKNDELVMLGVNKYPNKEDQMAAKVNLTENAIDPTNAIITPLPKYRLAAETEKKRLEAELENV